MRCRKDEPFNITCQITFISRKIYVIHHALRLFFPFSYLEMLSGCLPLYQNKLQEKEVQDIVNTNIIKLEPQDDLVDQTFSQFNENSFKNQDSYSQTGNDETPGAEYLNKNDSEDTETNKTATISNFMLQVLLDDEIEKSINSVNSKRLPCGSYMD